MNILENAINYSPPDSPIEITVTYTTTHVFVQIADRGIGTSPEDAGKIFDKFYRTQKAETAGIGLGLAICRSIIVAHHGKIWAEQRTGDCNP